MTVSKYAGRSTRKWKRLKRDFEILAAERKLPCWLDGQPIDYTLPKDHPDSFSVDHFHPVSTHPEHAEDPANLKASHRHCNLARGNRAPKLGLGRQTRNW